MKFKSCGVVFIIALVDCSSKQSNTQKTAYQNDYLRYFIEEQTESVSSKTAYDAIIRQAAQHHSVDENLIRAIIKVESNFRANAVSKSNTIGLMQVKASTAGGDAYRLQGKAGQPTTSQLKDPAINIDVGTAYIRFIQDKHLSNIRDPKILYYATVVAYVNGAGALLRIFDKDPYLAIDKTNKLTTEEFYQHIQTKHPSAQAPRYLWKIKTAYNSIIMID